MEKQFSDLIVSWGVIGTRGAYLPETGTREPPGRGAGCGASGSRERGPVCQPGQGDAAQPRDGKRWGPFTLELLRIPEPRPWGGWVLGDHGRHLSPGRHRPQAADEETEAWRR